MIVWDDDIKKIKKVLRQGINYYFKNVIEDDELREIDLINILKRDLNNIVVELIEEEKQY